MTEISAQADSAGPFQRAETGADSVAAWIPAPALRANRQGLL